MRIELPVPPSTNTLFRNVPGRGRVISGVYQRWQAAAMERFWNVKVSTFLLPVQVTITLPRGRGPDVDNSLKGVLDLLVKMGVIQDDNRKHVQRVTSQLGDVQECLVEVVPI